MKNYRIAMIVYEHQISSVGFKRAYALQKRIGGFFWYTVMKCDSKNQCKTVYNNVRDKKDKVIRVLDYLE